jgi:hypothetical protein
MMQDASVYPTLLLTILASCGRLGPGNTTTTQYGNYLMQADAAATASLAALVQSWRVFGGEINE